MAPYSAQYATDRLPAPGADARAPLKDWKDLINNGLSDPGPSQGQNATSVTEDPFPARVHPGGNNLIPLYCGLLGALICGLVLWIVFKQARRRGRDSKLQPPASATSLAPGDDLAASAPLTRAGWQDLATETCEFYEGGTDEASGINRRRVADLSESRIRRLEQVLDKDSVWKPLAVEMGYQADSISEFESKAQLNSTSPAGLLLRHWGASGVSGAATISDLRGLLLAAGLADALPCLRESAASAERRRGLRPVPSSAAQPVTESGVQNRLELSAVKEPQV